VSQSGSRPGIGDHHGSSGCAAARQGAGTSDVLAALIVAGCPDPAVWGREDDLQRLEFAVVFEVPGSDRSLLPASMRIPTGKPRRVAGAVVQHLPG